MLCIVLPAAPMSGRMTSSLCLFALSVSAHGLCLAGG